jgi:hypothetical protein
MYDFLVKTEVMIIRKNQGICSKKLKIGHV